MMSENSTLERGFQEKERVLVYDGPILYEAEVLQVLCQRDEGSSRRYLVHFIGWHRCNDQVVSENLMLPRTPSNLALAEALYESVSQEPVKQDASSAPAQPGVAGSASDSTIEGACQTNVSTIPETDALDNQVNHCRGLETVLQRDDDADALRWFELPDMLKRTILDDFAYVSERGQLYELPPRVNVANILHAWVRHRMRHQEGGVASIQAFADSLQRYFDAALCRMLLYEDEQAQYRQLMTGNPEKRASELYGGEHLLRLLVKLPWFLEQASFSEQEIRQLSQLFQDLCRFMLRHGRKYFHMEEEQTLEQIE
jgi:mortality factor 4-like protein 1